MEEKQTKAQIISDSVCSIIMALAVFVYIIWGITCKFWHPGWVIVVGAFLLCGIIGIIVDAKADLQKLDNKEAQNKEEK